MSEHSESVIIETAPAGSTPTLRDVLVRYTALMRSWREELTKIVPFRDYINRDPVVAQRFHEQVLELIKTLHDLG